MVRIAGKHHYDHLIPICHTDALQFRLVSRRIIWFQINLYLSDDFKD